MDSEAEVIRQIEAAFEDNPRPDNRALLWERCQDDADIEALYEAAHWRDVPDQVLVNQWGGLYFLGAAGFRHFLPAYMISALRHAAEGYAVSQAAVLALMPVNSEEKLAGFNRDQAAAVVEFLEFIAAEYSEDYPEVWDALQYWSDLAMD